MSTPGTGPTDRRRVVVVDDEATTAGAIADRLRAEGYEVSLAGDGPSAMALCEQVRPDLVVLDLMLPGFDGLEVCRRMRRDRHVPVLMLTARTDETDLLVGLGVGADDYRTKPFSPGSWWRGCTCCCAAWARRASASGSATVIAIPQACLAQAGAPVV